MFTVTVNGSPMLTRSRSTNLNSISSFSGAGTAKNLLAVGVLRTARYKVNRSSPEPNYR